MGEVVGVRRGEQVGGSPKAGCEAVVHAAKEVNQKSSTFAGVQGTPLRVHQYF